ncbi:MAG: PD-(D/E)XK nuclease family protein [Slackia sp.]|nr:PD-(D/E)XK nuclease family protein [Slackia sp.]
MRTVLFAQAAQALAFRRAHASADDALSFGTAVSSVGEWVAATWRLWGDGRPLANDVQRIAAATAALKDPSLAGIARTAGMARLVVRLADEVLGSAEWDALVAGEVSVDGRHEPLVRALRMYESALGGAGLIDAGRACAVLAASPYALRRGDAVVYDCQLSAGRKRLVLAWFSSLEYRESVEARIERAPEGVEVRFAFPSGRYAEPFVIVDAIERFHADGPVLLTSADPLRLYDDIASACMKRGLSLAVRARRAFYESDLGRALHAACRIVDAEAVDARACADFLLNPFSGVTQGEAYAFDAALRADRLVDKNNCLERLRAASSAFASFEALAAMDDACEAALARIESSVRTIDADEAYYAEQEGALSCVRSCFDAARAMGLTRFDEARMLEYVRFDVSRTQNAHLCDALIVDARRVEEAWAQPWATVFMCDMDNRSFSVKSADDAASALAAALGVARDRPVLLDLRRSFVAALAQARVRVVIERRLNDESADPTYPAATVEEFVDCYRNDPTDASEIDNAYALPPCLMEGLIERGEEALYENAAVRDEPQHMRAPVNGSRASGSFVSGAAAGLLVLPRVGRRGVQVSDPCFSASQVESYLECPRKWFSLRRLRLDELDEGFGALEMGDFSHGVLEDFYRRFQQSVARKVSVDTEGEARSLMREVIQEHGCAQFSKCPSSARLVPVTVFEQREVEELSEKLVGYLDREKDLLPEFAPYAFEYEIPVEGAVDYAGCKLMGKIDRIDVDGRGRAVIIDYKSSLSADYDLYEPQSKGGALRQGKVQTLMYAQAIRRLLGLEVVGALYVSYGRSPKVSGALSCEVEPLHVPGLRAETCVYRGDYGPGFHALLDGVEQRIAQALARLMDGCVEAAPATSRACSHCPALSCPQRKG